MNRESVIIKKIDISHPTQVRFFEIKIPREVEYIIGIEMGLNWKRGYPSQGGGGATWKLPMTMKSSIVMGDLKFQSYEQANIFYSGELVMTRNMDYGDFTSKWLVPRPYTHQLQALEEEIKVPGNTTIIKGVYRDMLHTTGLIEYKYTATIYIWTQSKEQAEPDSR